MVVGYALIMGALATGLRIIRRSARAEAAGTGAGGTGAGGTGAGAAGGTGKTQLAVGYAHAMWTAGAVDLLVWVPAASRTAILSGFAQAAADVDGEKPGESADAAARRFLGWLERTRRPWAVVLDDVTSAGDLDGLWPAGETGQVVVTTRLPETELRAADRTVVPVPGLSRREALAYLNSRLTGYPDQRIEALDLAEEVGGLPISMAHAAAAITESEATCRDYRRQYAERLRATADTVADGCPPSMLASWSLAVERAHELPPAGLAWPALAFAAVCGTCGIPAAVLTSRAACGYIIGRTPGVAGDDQHLVRAAYANLNRLDLVSVERTSAVRTVWVHPAVRAAVWAYLSRAGAEQVVTAAASALLEAWPDAGAAGAEPQLSQALRDCAAGLQSFAADLLWRPDAHPVLLRAGTSLEESLLADSAVTYWQSIATGCQQRLGAAHAQSTLARDRLAAAYSATGRTAEAIPVLEAALADRELELGAEHPDAVTARIKLAHCYAQAGREAEAIELFEQTLAQSERLFGIVHRDTLALRASLAGAYQAGGRPGDGVLLYERTLAESECALGPAHRDTLTARASLAGAYQAVGQLSEAIAAYERTLADRERTYGPDHPDTVAARASLAGACVLSGDHREALLHYERVLADRERIQGADHPDTMTARDDLAFAYRSAGKLKAAIPQYERTLADRERVQGPDHRDTLSTRANLAAAYQLARRMRDAIAQYQRALADCEKYLGADHPMTSTVRESLLAATGLPAAQHEDHAPGRRVAEHGRVVEVAVAGRERVTAGQPDRGGHFRRRPEPVGHHVAHRADRAVGAMSGDAHVL